VSAEEHIAYSMHQQAQMMTLLGAVLASKLDLSRIGEAQGEPDVLLAALRDHPPLLLAGRWVPWRDEPPCDGTHGPLLQGVPVATEVVIRYSHGRGHIHTIRLCAGCLSWELRQLGRVKIVDAQFFMIESG
jgi:hypothetical protein